ncbi:PIN domain-containing protein [Candidatus Woesearchaeota archaeon]|nr:PIN domain-containing protein [Candidatus Woesearchaeota archaeon]
MHQDITENALYMSYREFSGRFSSINNKQKALKIPCQFCRVWHILVFELFTVGVKGDKQKDIKEASFLRYQMKKYYLDASIWIDLYENRKGFNNEPLGDFAWKLFGLIKASKNKLVISDFLVRELESNYSIEEINGMIKPFEDIIERVFVTKKQKDEAKILAQERSLPPGDVLHSILARDNNLILITRDKHFVQLTDISRSYKPEEII